MVRASNTLGDLTSQISYSKNYQLAAVVVAVNLTRLDPLYKLRFTYFGQLTRLPMAKSIKALYENGVFKPLTKVRLKNRQRVKLTVVESKQSPKRFAKSKPKRRPASLRAGVAAHPAYRIVGLFKSGLHDLSENHDKYLYQ